MILRATPRAMNRANNMVYTRVVRYAAKDFFMKNKDIKRLKIVTKLKATRKEPSAVTYINKYNETMTVDRFYNEGDTYSSNVNTYKNEATIGRSFTFETPTRFTTSKSREIWARRSARKTRINNVWKSSRLKALRYRRTVRNVDRILKVYERFAKRKFKERFEHEIREEIRKAGL
jgi:hypothetical protein